MGAVIPIHSRRTFTKEEAESLLPIIRRITDRAAEDAKEIHEQLKFVPGDEPLHKRLHMEMDRIIRRWAIKVSQLGCEPRGIWLVDFDAGDGCFSWRIGDESLSYFHPYAAPQDRGLSAPHGELPT